MFKHLLTLSVHFRMFQKGKKANCLRKQSNLLMYMFADVIHNVASVYFGLQKNFKKLFGCLGNKQLNNADLCFYNPM